MSAGVTIREATAADAPDIHRALLTLAEHVGEMHRVVSTVDDIRRYGFEASPPHFTALVAEVDGAFAGISLFFPTFSTWYGRPGVYVQDLVVEPGFRGMDIGRALMRATARRAAAGGATHMKLAVDTQNVSAQAFYARMGLRHADEDFLYYAAGDAFEALAAGDGEGR